jgi:hypothetical protein
MSESSVVAAADAVMRIVAGLIRMRADADTSIGTPTRVSEIDPPPQFKFGSAGVAAATAMRIDFACHARRTCPISKETHATATHAILRADERTGLLAVYIHCPSCSAKERAASAGSGGYCFVGVLPEDESDELEELGAFEKARLRIAAHKAEMAKITWQCVKCYDWFAESDRPSIECCSEHRINDEWVCEECNWREPCERFTLDREYAFSAFGHF